MLSSLEIVRSSAAELVHQRGISDRHRELDAARVTARSNLQPWQVERAVVHVAAAEHHPGAMTAHRRKEAVRRSGLGGQQHQRAVGSWAPADRIALDWRNRRDLRGRLATSLLVLGLELGGGRPVNLRKPAMLRGGVPCTEPCARRTLLVHVGAIGSWTRVGPAGELLGAVVFTRSDAEVLIGAEPARPRLLVGDRSCAGGDET